MSLNISSNKTNDFEFPTTSSQENNPTKSTDTNNPQEKTNSIDNTTSFPFAEQLSKIDSSVSKTKDKTLNVDIPVNSEKTNFTNYEQAFLKAGFREVGLPNVTDSEINKFQQSYSSITNNRIGLNSSLTELKTEQNKNGGSKISVKVSDYDLKVFSAGKEQILAQRQQDSLLSKQTLENSKAYTDDAFAGFYKLQINGLVNTVNEATKLVDLPEIPKLEVKGEYWKDKKDVVELGTTVAAGVLTGNVPVVGTAITGLTGAAHGVELVSGKDYRSGQQLSPLERSLRFVSSSTSALAVAKPASEVINKVANKLDDLDLGGPPTLQPATASGPAISSIPIAKSTNPSNIANSPNLFNQAANSTSGVSQLPKEVDPTKPSNTTDPTELTAKTEADRLEKLDGGHSIDRHGPEVTDQALQERLTKGITPNSGGKIQNAPPGSTRFNTYKDWVETRNDAVEAIAKNHGIDLSKPPPPGHSGEASAIVEHSRPIDDGFVGNTASKNKVIDPSTGKKVSVYGKIEAVEGISRTYTKLVWNQQNLKWDVVQHYPNVSSWDNVNKTYSVPANIVINKTIK